MPARGTATNRGVASGRGLASGRLTASGRLNVSGGGGGGGGADLTNVSSLPSPGSADATAIYHLSTDDHCYMLNAAGTAMVAVDYPGWARNDGTNDTEWEMANADPPSGWAWDSQQSGMSVNVNNTQKSFIVMTGTTASGFLGTLYRSATFTTSGKTILAPISLQPNSSAGDTWGGLVIRNSSNARAIVLYLKSNANAYYLAVQEYTTSSGSGSEVLQDNTEHPSLNEPLMLGINNDGTNLNFLVGTYQGGAKPLLHQIYTETLVNYITAAGGSADQYGLMIRQNLTANMRMINDWIRVV